MRPGAIGGPSPAAAAVMTSSDVPDCFWRWDSPLPYLFGGLAAMMVLIAVALIILACTNRKSSSTGGCPSDGQKPMPAPVDAEPSVVVILAGDALPTCLAKAVPPSPARACQGGRVRPEPVELDPEAPPPRHREELA